MCEYIQQADQFLKKSNTSIKICKVGVVEGFPFDNDNLLHCKYRVTLRRKQNMYSFIFFDSYSNYKECKSPTPYDILASLQSYPVPDNVNDFAFEYGYDICDKKSYNKVRKIWSACKRQYEKLSALYDSEFMEELCKIQ